MIFDATDTDRGRFEQEYDVCVIGAGPAGITLARVLAASGARVALMEAGGLEITEESQDVYRGTNIGQDYFDLDISRLRYFGGTSNHWGGWTRALDAYDFRAMDHHPLSGWPITRLDLDRYQPAADDILDIPSETEAPDLPMRQKDYDFKRFQFRWSPPTRFNTKYGPEIEASPEIDLVLNANLVDLRLTDDLDSVSGAVFRSYLPEDPGFTIRARAFCLCTGGIENARLLLNFTSQVPEGIGNGSDMVGRCFCDHPHFLVGEVLLRSLVVEREFYSPTETLMLDAEMLNFGMRLEPRWIWPEDLSSLAHREMEPEKFAILLNERVRDPGYDPALASHPDVLTSKGQEAVMRMAQEHSQNPDSRVRLGEERDAFGLRRVELDWQLSELDFHTMRTAATTFAAHLAEQDLGRARLEPWLLEEPPRLPRVGEDEVGGNHHMSTTRMAEDPAEGVVDRDCKVHGINNLYIGGSSVFASTGHCNPTYTIVQLALRLGDHLSEKLRG